MKRKISQPTAWVIALFGTIGGSVAMATPTEVTMQLTGPPPGPSLDGYYTSPYTALIGASGQTLTAGHTTITGTSFSVICDDFTTDVSIATPPWQAYQTQLSSLAAGQSTTLKFDTGSGLAHQQQVDYMTAAYLAEQLMGEVQLHSSSTLYAEELSYAIWQVFAQTTVQPYLSSTLTGGNAYIYTDIENYFNAAKTAVTTDSRYNNILGYSNVLIFTPSPTTASQEYIVVTGPINPVPEPGTAIFGLAMLGAVVVGRRRLGEHRTSTLAQA